MEKIEVKVNDRYSFEICINSKIILIRKYTQNECTMTINYPDKWFYTRAVQHAFSIVQSLIDGHII